MAIVLIGLPVLFLLGCSYFFFRMYLVKHGKPVVDLAKNIALCYGGSIILGIGISLFSLPFFLDNANSDRYNILELSQFAVWGAAFIVPLVYFLQKRVGAPLWYTLLVVVIPLFSVVVFWSFGAYIYH